VTVDAPIRWDGHTRESTPGPPRAGQHNHEILAPLGYDETEIAQLSAEPT
jgi:crotonobetainyl-CoA:carnitine CoA-transferase CaiB-like acyl-CoA transferase